MRLWKLLWPLRARLSRGLAVGSTFPDFALRDTAGVRRRLSDAAPGTLTVMWFTNFCEDCLAQVPTLESAAREARVLAVSILAADDPKPPALAARLGFPVLLDPEDLVSRRLGLAHPPGACPLHNLFIVDAAGRILFKHHLSALGPEGFRKAWRGLTGRPEVTLSGQSLKSGTLKERLLTGLALAAVLASGFWAIDLGLAGSGRPAWLPKTALDAAIPLLAGWVWVYFLYYPFCFAPLLLPQLRRDIAVFRRAASGLALQFAAAFCVFWAFPSRVERPDVLPGGVSGAALGLLYSLDPGYNAFPSLHAANAVFVAALVGRFAPAGWAAAAWTAAALIAASCVLVKQHYVLDVPAGALLGLAAYGLAFLKR